MADDEIKSDVVLVVCKEKVHKAKPHKRTVKLQTEMRAASVLGLFQPRM